MANEDDLFVDVALNNTHSVVVQLKETVVAEPVSTYVASSKKELHYHIVAGCFSKKGNAKKMVKKSRIFQCCQN